MVPDAARRDLRRLDPLDRRFVGEIVFHPFADIASLARLEVKAGLGIDEEA